tara:strand:+ start:151 stop:372 length:222 start_codon:yes stop_codon:yes gene_type:complete
MRLGLGLNFLHRLISDVAVATVAKYLLQEDGDFLMLEEPIQLFTQAGDTLITQDGFSLVAAQSGASGQIQLEQ